MNAPQKILIVEDDVALAHAISINLKARSYEVRTANTASLALRIAGEWSPDLILLDLGLPEIAAMGALERLDVMLNDALYGILFRDINMQNR